MISARRGPYTFDEAVAMVRGAGFTHVLTMAGPTPVAEWSPYGQARGERYRVRVDIVKGRVYDEPPEHCPPGFGLGVWTLLWLDEAAGALDPDNAMAYVSMLRRAHELGAFRQVIFVSHSQEVWEAADARLFVADGRVTTTLQREAA